MTGILIALLMGGALGGQKFYPDDPLTREPEPMRVDDARFRKLNDQYDLFMHTLGSPGEQQPENLEPIGALSINTLDEVPDNPWFTNRIGSRDVSIGEIRQGPGSDHPPDTTAPWKIVAGKTEGVTPGFRIEDARGEQYLLKFDPATNPEMATGADVVGSVLFHALGYNVPENYLVTFDRDQLVIGEDATIPDRLGQARPISNMDVKTALARVPRSEDGRLRAIASRLLPGKILGEFRYHSTRADDPNDIVPHEHRRELRGLFVFCAWLNHNDSRSINTLDSLVVEGDLKYVRHYLIDFGATLGSASVVSNTARDGNAYFFEFKQALAQLLSLGAYVPAWARANYRKSTAIGMINHDEFDPEKWKPNYWNPAFANRLPNDTFWAAKKVMAFSDEHIRAAVEQARYSDPEDTAALTEYLIARRDKIGEVYFARVLPVDEFRLSDGQLEFEDLAVKYGLVPNRVYTVEWSRFNNETDTLERIGEGTSFSVPDEARAASLGSYFTATIRGDSENQSVAIYMRTERGGHRIVGVERTW